MRFELRAGSIEENKLAGGGKSSGQRLERQILSRDGCLVDHLGSVNTGKGRAAILETVWRGRTNHSVLGNHGRPDGN